MQSLRKKHFHTQNSLFTGFTLIDAATGGLIYQEFGLLVGHSGAGKTALALHSAIQNARMGRRVLYLTLEEKPENLLKRIYSNLFKIPYTSLHKGCELAQSDLTERFITLSEREKLVLSNLLIHDLRGTKGLTGDFLKNYLENLYQKDGYHPDLVYIDQMDYLETNSKYDHEWQKYQRISFEIDGLSNYLIGKRHKFSVWLLHQASGKISWKYSNEQISGFTGVIRPADMVIAIGRMKERDDMVKLFSLKVRHSRNFEFDHHADFEFMNFRGFYG